MPFVKEELKAIVGSEIARDYKTRLQQLVQQSRSETGYVTVGEAAPTT